MHNKKQGRKIIFDRQIRVRQLVGKLYIFEY